MYDKDYYQILGVMPTAEDIVIRAAYKALAQRYHPDKYQGDPAEAKRIMQEIIEAYSILSDSDKRKHYDAWLSQQTNGSEYQTEDQDDELNVAMAAYDRDWNTACSIYPDLQEHYLWLNKVAHRLGATYKVLLLETKKFQDRKRIASLMEDEFFKSYFGDNADILSFAKSLVMDGRKGAAKALNNYVRVVGQATDSRRVIDAVCDEYGIANPRKIREEALEQERQEWIRKFQEEKTRKEAGEKLRLAVEQQNWRDIRKTYMDPQFGSPKSDMQSGVKSHANWWVGLLITLVVLMLGAFLKWSEPQPTDVPPWILIDYSSQTRTYADPSTLQPSGNNVAIRALMDKDVVFEEEGKPVMSAIADIEVDCKGGRMKNIEVSMYSKNMGKGSLVSPVSLTYGWFSVDDSPGPKKLMEYACRKR